MLILKPAIKPMGEIINSCVIDLDATIYDSYIGSGQSFANIEPTPADSSSQTQYDFYRGADVTATTDDPTFNGTAGNNAAYWSFDGGDYFLAQNVNTAFIENLHDTTAAQDFTFVMAYYHINANVVLATNRSAGGAAVGVMMYSLSADNKLRLLQRGDTANSTTIASTGTLNTSAWNFCAVAHSHSGNTSRVWLNSATAESGGDTFNATTAAASSTKFAVGAYGGGTLPIANTGRMRCFMAFNEYMDDTQMKAVIDQLGARHNHAYV